MQSSRSGSTIAKLAGPGPGDEGGPVGSWTQQEGSQSCHRLVEDINSLRGKCVELVSYVNSKKC